MSISQTPEWVRDLLEYHGKRPDSLVSGGMVSLCPLIPENVIVRVDSNSSIVPKETYVHRRMILKTILSGSLNTIIDGLSFPMKAGDSVLFFPFQFHSSIDAEGCPKHSFAAISFTMPDNNIVPLLPLKNRVLHLGPADLAALKEIVGAFYGNNDVSHSQAILKLSAVLLNQLEKCPETADAVRAVSSCDIHQNIYDFIRENFNKKLSLKSLAARFGCSTEKIRKIFQRNYPGLTPGRLIVKLQMQEAMELLENTSNPIGDIAEKCGYSDVFTFSKKFRKVTGRSPREYRMAMRSPQENFKPECKADGAE